MVGHPQDSYLQALKPIYGLKKSPGYWWQTYYDYQISDLELKQSSLDPCLFFKKKDGKIIGLIGNLVDDAIITGNEELINHEAQKCQRFDVKKKVEYFLMKFGGMTIAEEEYDFSISQQEYANSLQKISVNSLNERDLKHLPGQLAYIASSTRPDVAFNYAWLSKVKASGSSVEHVKMHNSSVDHLKKNQ